MNTKILFFASIVLILSLTSCAFTYKSLTPGDAIRINKNAKIDVTVTGDVKGLVFVLEKESIKAALLEELNGLSDPSSESAVTLDAQVKIIYVWKSVPYFLLWPFVIFGAPAGKHIGTAEIVLTLIDADRVEYRATGKIEKLQGLYYNWQYDPPVKGGVIRYAIRDAMNDIRRQLMLKYPEK